MPERSKPRHAVVINIDPEEGLVRPEFKDDCEIKRIIARAQRTGVITHLNARPPEYLECTVNDFESALALVEQAESDFAELPSRAREHFDNDPAKFIAFMENPDADVLKELGMRAEGPWDAPEGRISKEGTRGLPGPESPGEARTAPLAPGPTPPTPPHQLITSWSVPGSLRARDNPSRPAPCRAGHLFRLSTPSP